MLPPIPSWDGLHPIIVHFPIALLIVAPILIILGLIFHTSGRAFLVAAFVLILIGTIATFIAVSTGESAGELAERVANVEGVLEDHEELAETTRNIFTALTTIFAAIIFIPMIFKKELGRSVMVPLCLAFLLFYGAGTVVLLNTAHAGGRLVHEFGVRALLSTNGQTAAHPNHKEDDDD